MRPSRISAAVPAALLTAVFSAAGCGDGTSDEPNSSGAESTAPTLAEMPDPASFTTVIDNPHMPLVPGTVYTFEGGGETITVETTSKTREVMGVETVVVHDVVSESGEVTEDTYDYYAQDADGNVWYFGEDSSEMSGGKVTTTKGSWEAGVDGARPGIVMEADPQVGDYYYQENYPGHAEDTGKVLALDEQVDVPYGSFDHVLKTEDVNPLDNSGAEHKFYVEGIGVVLETGAKDSDARVELTGVEQSK